MLPYMIRRLVRFLNSRFLKLGNMLNRPTICMSFPYNSSSSR